MTKNFPLFWINAILSLYKVLNCEYLFRMPLSTFMFYRWEGNINFDISYVGSCGGGGYLIVYMNKKVIMNNLGPSFSIGSTDHGMP